MLDGKVELHQEKVLYATLRNLDFILWELQTVKRVWPKKQQRWASLLAPSVMQETWVQSLGWEDALEKEMTTYSSILA